MTILTIWKLGRRLRRIQVHSYIVMYILLVFQLIWPCTSKAKTAPPGPKATSSEDVKLQTSPTKMIAMNFRMMASRNQLEYPFQRKKFQKKEYRTKWKATTEFLNITVPMKEISVRYRVHASFYKSSSTRTSNSLIYFYIKVQASQMAFWI